MPRKRMTAPEPVQDLALLPINSIVPYWRNPRNATDSDIAKVMRSIQEYGYQSPIIVDADNVIIVGHTRYLALRRLGYTEVEVLVTDLDTHAAREYRIIDNRAGEFTAWDRERLLEELKGFTDPSMLATFFPELDLEDDELGSHSLSLPGEPELDIEPTVPSRAVTCPSCYQAFDVAEEDMP